MDKNKDTNKNDSQVNLSIDDMDSSKDTQLFSIKGIEYITDEIREKLMAFIQEKIKEIKKQEKDIKGDINNLAKTIQEIVDKNHKDFISTFANFMDSVRKDLKLKLEQMEKIEEEKRKINDVKLVKCERDYFRLEAIRLSRMTNSLKKKIDDMALRMKLLNESVNNLQLKLKDSEGVNKQLLLELEKNIQSHKEIERELITLKDIYTKENEDINKRKYKNINNINNEDGEDAKLIRTDTNSTQVNEYDRRNQEIALMNEQIRRLRNELKKEKERSHMALGELNKIYLERNKLENIFIDCVEETRKIIFNRKLKENNGGYKIKQRIGGGKYDYKMNLITKYESFLPTDKQSILENFVFNDEVSNIIRDAIFTRPKKEKEKFENTKNIIKNLNLYEQNKRRTNSTNIKKHPISGFQKDGKQNINQKFNDAMKEMENNGGIQSKLIGAGNQFYKTGRMTMTNFREHQYGHSSKITIPMQIN
jgi:hypothetical protein